MDNKKWRGREVGGDKKGKRLRLSKEEVEIINEIRGENLDNINGNTALDLHLKERGINKDDVVSVKHWQSMSGDLRFSIVTKEGDKADETDVLEKITELIEEHSPKYEKIKRKKSTKEQHLLVINPADIHIGKYANSDETVDGYNTEIAYNRVLEGIYGILDKVKGFEIDRVLFCIGNDVLHIDNVYNQTTAGTNQDCEGKWWEHYNIALKLYVRCVEILREVAPVDCVHSMSNHDYQSGFHLAKNLESWFRNAKDITVDSGVSHRKYYKYGSSLIGLEHGDGAKMADLPLLMANERPKEWSETKYRYWYLHHIHHKVKHKWLDAKDYIGATVEYLRSPSGTDSWHSRKGFTGVPKAVEGFLHSEFNGQIARITHYF
tara:strand:+ start:1177 stop:2307 length:1131 start_codon:yes stop_codon:yes gene_type:complete